MNWERQARYIKQEKLYVDAEKEKLERKYVGLARIAFVGYTLLALDLVVRILG